VSEPTQPPEPITSEDDPQQSPAPQQRGATTGTLKRVVTTVARSVVGLIGVAVAIIVIGAAALVPLPTVRYVPPSVIVTPVPAAQRLICPGAVLRLGDEAGTDATSAHALGIPTTVSAATSGTVESTPLDQADPNGKPAAAPIVLSVQPSADGGSAADLAGAQAQKVSSGDIHGLVASQCAQASTSTWLVGGSTVVGRTTIIRLANPSDIVATVAIEVFGENGAVSAPGSAGILVSGHSEKVLSLAGFAPDLEEPVVHVTSRGGPIAASLQQSVVRGIEPGGVDMIAATTMPSKSVVVPGLVISNGSTVATLLGADGFKDLGTVLRVFVPGDKAATARVSVVPESADGAGASFGINLDAGRVTDVPIDGLDDGVYSVALLSDVPVVGAVRASTIAQGASAGASEPATDSAVDSSVDSAVETVEKTVGASDFAWFAASNPLVGSAFVAIAPGPGSALHLANPGDKDETVTLLDSSGNTVAITVPAGATVSADVSPGSSYRLDGFGTVLASVSYLDHGLLASYAIAATSTGSEPITIYP
jgi:Family of unknown function (DUF5719)